MTAKPLHPKNILLAVSGLTPQVITETLYYLTQKKKPPVIISEIWVLTTLPGKELIERTLLDKKKGAFYSFCKEYGIDASQITFDTSTIILLKAIKGKPLTDIKTPEENRAVADSITNLVKELASHPHTRLHCSIAGGRKTMSLYLGYALQLFGRPDDALYHVLVSPEFESHPNFFYPPRKNTILTYQDSRGDLKQLHTKDACIELAEIPYIRLREKLTSIFGEQDISYSEMVSRAQRDLDHAYALPDLRILCRAQQIAIGEHSCPLPPLQMAILTHFARKKIESCVKRNASACNHCTQCFENIGECTAAYHTLLKDYQKMVSPKSALYQNISNQWLQKGGIPPETLRQNISKINRTLTTLHDSQLYHISSLRKYGNTRYGIRLDRSKIKLVEQ